MVLSTLHINHPHRATVRARLETGCVENALQNVDKCSCIEYSRRTNEHNDLHIYRFCTLYSTRSWTEPGKILERAWKDHGRILKRAWKDHGRILKRAWKEPEKSLKRAWKYPGNILEIS